MLLPHDKNATSPGTSVQMISAPSTGNNANSAAGNASPGSRITTPSSPPTTNRPPSNEIVTSSPTSTSSLPVSSMDVINPSSGSGGVVPSVPARMEADDHGTTVQSFPTFPTAHSPASASVLFINNQPPPPEVSVLGTASHSIPMEPPQDSRPPLTSAFTPPTLSFLPNQPLSLVTDPRIAHQSPPTIAQAPFVTQSVVHTHTSHNNIAPAESPQTVAPPSVSTPRIVAIHVSQNSTPSQVQASPATSPIAPSISSSSVQQKQNGPLRRQSLGLDFLQLDLQVAREKKQRAAAEAAEAQRSASATQTSPVPLPSHMPSMSGDVALTAAAAGAPTTTTANESNVLSTSQPPKAQVPISSPVYRDLRQGSTRNSPSFANPRKLQITDRAPAPPPEPGSSGAPIVIDEDEAEPVPAPAYEPMEIDVEVKALPDEGAQTAMALNPQDVEDRRLDHEPRPEQEVLTIYTASEPVILATSTLGAADATAEISSAPPTPGLLSSVVAWTSAISTSKPSALTTSARHQPQDASSREASDAKDVHVESGGKDSTGGDSDITGMVAEQGETTANSLQFEDHSHSSIDIASDATINPSSGNMSPTPSMDCPQPALGVIPASKSMKMDLIPPEPASTSAATGVNSSPVRLPASDEPQSALSGVKSIEAGSTPRLDVLVPALRLASDKPKPLSDLAELHPSSSAGEHAPGISVSDISLTSGRHQRSSPATDEDASLLPVRTPWNPIAKRQRDVPAIILPPDTTKSSSPISLTFDPPRESEGGSMAQIGRSVSLKSVNQVTSNSGVPNSGSDASATSLSGLPQGLFIRTNSLSDTDISRFSITPPPIVVLETRSRVSSASNRSSNSRSVSPSSERKLSEAGTEPVKVEEVEDDEMIDELAPLFGKEMKILCMDRAYDIPGELTWDFTLPGADWDMVSLWTSAPDNVDSDISRARCITLACYSIQDLAPYATQDGITREQWFENTKPVPWAMLPRSLWVVINNEATVVFPPYVAPDDLLDVSPFLRRGQNKISFTQIGDMAEYVLVLHGHYPTRGLLEPVYTRWEQEKYFQEQLAWLSRPFTIE
ncbi:hypothetical protein B0F90DRAFT_1308448 [Multifurca ochricompacta]|uniref:Uncharacterized protein n=1 Tax=Multifurca ochricompacta TaxID=376703 RepID=A0AAD4M696_9AGAM|nr:hypothetical protein B0F90DRAFT_1308448 [Multifurca ochricompacta]